MSETSTTNLTPLIKIPDDIEPPMVDPGTAPAGNGPPPAERSFNVTSDEFIDSGEIYFQDKLLNTSARRFIFISNLVADDPAIEGTVAFPAHIVFACLATDREIVNYTRSPDHHIAEFQKWADAVELVPTNPVFAVVAETAQLVLDGWVGGGNDVDEEVSPGKSSATSPSGPGS